MKPLIPIVVSAGLALASAASQAADTHPLQPNAPRTVTVSEADTPPVIRAGLLQSTLIVLPAEEKVANVFAGDTVDWVFDGGHVASRFISVKPKVANGSTDIHIVSDHGNEYTLHLSLPQRYMDTHYRWLRMMVALTTTEMEITRGQPATGHPILMVLDEFAGLKRMTAIENAVAQIAGFGVKLLFVLQSLEQLKHTYKDNWETFLSNAGLKIFFSVEDHFTREYVSKLIGQTEVIREMQSSNQNASESEGYSKARSDSETLTQSTTKGDSLSRTTGTNESTGWSQGQNFGLSYQKWRFLFLEGTKNATHSQGSNTGSSGSRGSNVSDTVGRSSSDTNGRSETAGTSETYSQNSSTSRGTGTSETLHLRPLVQPDEMGRAFARIDDKKHPAYPGLALVTVTGANPLVVWRRNYFEDVQFIGCFSPHPDYKFIPISRPSAGFDTASFHRLFDDYWHDRIPLDRARALLGSALDKTEREQKVFCNSIQNPQWRSEAEERCDSSMVTINSIFSVALYEKTGKPIERFPLKPQKHTLEFFHQKIDHAGMESECAYYNSRGVGLVRVPDFNYHAYLMKMRELIPGYGMSIDLPNSFGWAMPFLPGRYPTEPPPQPEVLPYKKKITPEQNKKFIRQMIVYGILLIIIVVLAIWIIPLLPSGPDGH